MRTGYDAAVIGAGLLGCFAARELVRYGLHTVVLEQREDVCTGISRANSAIVYTGCDTKPGTIRPICACAQTADLKSCAANWACGFPAAVLS